MFYVFGTIKYQGNSFFQGYVQRYPAWNGEVKLKPPLTQSFNYANNDYDFLKTSIDLANTISADAFTPSVSASPITIMFKYLDTKVSITNPTLPV